MRTQSLRRSKTKEAENEKARHAQRKSFSVRKDLPRVGVRELTRKPPAQCHADAHKEHGLHDDGTDNGDRVTGVSGNGVKKILIGQNNRRVGKKLKPFDGSAGAIQTPCKRHSCFVQGH